MSTGTPFTPARGANKVLNATTSNQTVAVGLGNKGIRFVNAGTTVVFVRTFDSVNDKAADKVASSADTPIAVSGAAGSVLVIEKPVDHDSLAYIAASGTPTLYAQPGEGGY